MKRNSNRTKTYKLVLVALLTAIVVVLQFLAIFMRGGLFAISLVLIPVVIGSVVAGPGAGAWLGFVFGVTVLASGDAAPFLAVNVPATIAVVLLKGALSGLAAGIIFRLFAKRNRYAAVVASAIICPVVNTGVFLLGTVLFFMPMINEWASAGGVSAVTYIFTGLIGLNFIIELVINIVLSPVVVRLIDMPQLKQNLK